MPDVAPNSLPPTAGGRFSDLAGSGPVRHAHPPPGDATNPSIAPSDVDAAMPAADSSILMDDGLCCCVLVCALAGLVAFLPMVDNTF